MAEARGWVLPAFAIVAGITALRVALLTANRTDLFVDEAQYWLWGQDLAFGYYSKPPLVAWVIRAATEIAGSDAPFWVRLPAPLLHAATAMILGAVAARIYGRAAAIAVASAYATLPMVALGSLLISTDTVMFPFLALALWLYGRLIAAQSRAPVLALGTGIALGLAFLAKYAALYYLGLGAMAAAFWPAARPGAAAAALILAAFGLTVAPNLAWNIANGLTTLTHTAENIGWVREGAGINVAGLLEFLAAQFAVFGPILFAALVALAVARARGRAQEVPPLLLSLSLPILALVSVQALLSKAYANWAAAAYLAGTLAVVPWLMRRPRWLVASFVVNGAVCLALPLATVLGEGLRVGEDLVLRRYLGRAEMSARLIDAARESGATAIVADNRDILADLFYSGREAGLPIFAWPQEGPPPNHYAQRYPFTGEVPGPVLAASLAGAEPPCAPLVGASSEITGGAGAYQGRTIRLFLLPPDCWNAN